MEPQRLQNENEIENALAKTEGSSENSEKATTSGAQGTEGQRPPRPKLSGSMRRKLKKTARGAKTSTVLKATPKGADAKAGTPKRHRSDNSTPQEEKRPSKKVKGTVKETHSFKDAVTGFKMAFVDEDPEKMMTEEETGKIKAWILQKIDDLPLGTTSPRFTECRHRGGALLITCSDQATRDWLSGVLKQEAPWEGAKLRFVEAKNLPKPMRTLVWIPGPPEEPEKILRRVEKQNQGISTKEWKVVDRKEDPKGQQLVVLMDLTSWEKMGACDHRPYVNFTRVTFKALARPKKGKEGEEEKMEEGPSEEPQPSTSAGPSDL